MAPNDKKISDEVIPIEGAHTLNCRNCGKNITLWFNGGELDREECCGFIYSLEHGEIHLVIYEKGASC